MTAAQTSATFAFGDPNVRGGMNKRPERFSVENGMAYRLRVLTEPVAFYGANVKNLTKPNSGFFGISLAPYELAERALAGDQQALAAAKQACPLFAGGYDMSRKFCVLVHVISKWQQGRPDRVTPVDQVLPWAFGNDKYAKITAVVTTMPKAPNGQPIPLKAIELVVTCVDENFQKVDIVPMTHPTQMALKFSQSWAKAQHLFDRPNSPMDPGNCVLVQESVEPDDYASMVKSLARMNGTLRDDAGGGQPGADEFSGHGQQPMHNPGVAMPGQPGTMAAAGGMDDILGYGSTHQPPVYQPQPQAPAPQPAVQRPTRAPQPQAPAQSGFTPPPAAPQHYAPQPQQQPVQPQYQPQPPVQQPAAPVYQPQPQAAPQAPAGDLLADLDNLLS